MTSKTTHTMHDVEGMILERLNKLRDSKDMKEQKKLRSEILKLEKHFNDCNEKYQNGHKYPIKKKIVPTSKEELFKLIDSVPDHDDPVIFGRDEQIRQELDVTGVFTKGALE